MTDGIDPSYTTHVTMDTGGSFTEGQLIDVMQLYAVTNPSKGSASPHSVAAPFGFPIGTYHIKLTNINFVTVTGIFKARWEERP